jgi:two-component system LytT family response regulator
MAEPCRVLLVDDEAPARAKVRRFLGADPRFQIVGEARDGLEALDRVRELRPELLFLDIQMPGLTGFEVLEQLEPPRPQVVFATAYDAFALAAFEAHAVDYLLKPFDEGRFKTALDRAWALLQGGKGESPSMKALLAGLAKRPLERLVVKDGDRWIPLALRAVSRLSAEGKQVRVHSDQGMHLVRLSLQDLESRLDARRFVRVHRGEIIALEAVAHLEPWDHGDALLVLKGGGKVVLSRTYRKGFLERWGLEG